MKKNKIFIACDSSNIAKIKKIIRYSQNSRIKFGYKFGLEFLNSKNGRAFVSKLNKKIIFADLKLHDIPNTCASALKDLRINYLTIHISSGLEALRSVKKIAGKTKIVGVSILTSLNNKSLKEIGYKMDVKKLVLHQARLAKKAKLDAIVCSAQEATFVKKIFKGEIITPGIRFSTKTNDQKRVLTPKQAFKNGSDWLVIGRPITEGNIKKNIKILFNHLNK
jgi:orotidine-5'-phosphate decarboxylase